MAPDVFISYSPRDRAIADAVVAGLETHRIRCWIAPRDALPGVSWLDAIMQAIGESKAFLLILSSASISSPQMIREVAYAVDRGIPIMPFRIEDVSPGPELTYYLSSLHWVDALTPPLEQHVERVYGGLQSLLAVEPPSPAVGPVAVPVQEPPDHSPARSEQASPQGRVAAPVREAPYPRESPSVFTRLGELLKSVLPARHPLAPAGTEPQPPQVQEQPAQSKGYIFISYVREDTDFVNTLRELLKARGYAYWDYTAGERDYHGALYRELEERIYGAEAFIAVVSDNWRQSDWVASEFTYARDANKPIFVVQAKRMAKPFPILLNLQTRIDMSASSELGRRTLLEELSKKGL